MAFSDQRQFLVTVTGVDGNFWAMTSGGDVSVPTAKAYDGGSATPQIVYGNPVVDDLVVTRNYNPTRDGPIAKTLKAQMAAGRPLSATIHQQPSDPAFKSTGTPPDVWAGVLTRVTTPKTNATTGGTATPATFALTFTCTSLA
jgi:hypothetical protein